MCNFLNYLTIVFSVYILYTSAELTEFLHSNDEVSGVYKAEDGSLGIKFISRQGFLQIETLTNITLIYFSSFHEVDKRMARSIQLLDEEYLQHKHSHHSHLDRSIGNTARSFKDTLNNLLQVEEITLLEDASHAIGDQGVTGKDTPAVLPFYMFALKVTRLLDTSMQNSTMRRLQERPYRSIVSKVLKFIAGIFVTEYVTSTISGSEECKEYQKYSDCKGLCGIKCECWWFVCEDCCFHLGCFKNDECCERFGYDHNRCIAEPSAELQCNGFHEC